MTTATTKQDVHAVIDRVSDTDHGQLVAHLSRLDRLMAYVAARNGLSYFKLQPIAQLFVELERSLRRHIADRQEILFPLLRQLGTDHGNNLGISDTLVTVIHEVNLNDERIAMLFRQISELTDGYDPASNACSAYQDIVHSLGTLDQRTRMYCEAEGELLSQVGRVSQRSIATTRADRVEAV